MSSCHGAPKDTTLQVSCITCNQDGLDLLCYNAMPDFTGTYEINRQKHTLLVGEVQLSPLTQMVLAGLGHYHLQRQNTSLELNQLATTKCVIVTT